MAGTCQPPLRRQVYNWLSIALASVYPPSCLACARPLPGDDDPLCGGCRAELPRNRPCCPRCAEALPATAAAVPCAACQRRPPPWQGAIVPWRFALPLDRLLHRFKYAGDLAAGRGLGRLLAGAVAQRLRRGERRRPDALVPVPLHPARLRRRGFNQAGELARALGAELGLEVLGDGLRRVRDTPAQAGLDAATRRRNLRGAFVAAPWVSGRHLVLVDDVVTTGSTAAAASRALLDGGAASVELWALARA